MRAAPPGAFPFVEENGKARLPQAGPTHLNTVPPLVQGWRAACIKRGIVSSTSNPSAPDPNTQAFPHLTSTQIDRIRPLGHIRRVQSGETLFEPNDSSVPFFVVLSGQLDVSRPTLDGERLVTTHTPGCFNGEMAMISGQRCLVRGRVMAGQKHRRNLYPRYSASFLNDGRGPPYRVGARMCSAGRQGVHTYGARSGYRRSRRKQHVAAHTCAPDVGNQFAGCVCRGRRSLG
jgi:hypothetical protein